jgi:hypothetical protein
MDMPEEEYHALDHISASKLKMVHKSPSHLHGAEAFKTTPDMEMGTAFHSVTLEPEKDGVIYHTAKTAAAKDYKQAVINNPGKIVLTLPRSQLLKTMKRNFEGSDVHKRMMAGRGASEVTILGELEGVKTKCRIDRLKFTDDGCIIYDLKTIATMPKSPKAFYYEILKWLYHLQNAWYWDMCVAAGLKPLKFYFIFVEKSAPYNFYQVHLSDEVIQDGRLKAYSAFDKYIECKESGIWPSPYELGGVGSLCVEKPE